MSEYLEGKEPPLSELKRILRKAAIDNTIIPVLCGSALKNKGVQLMLDAVVDYLPSPSDMPPVKGINPKTETEETREPKDDAPLAALAFKIAAHPPVASLTFFFVFSFTIRRGSYVLNTV